MEPDKNAVMIGMWDGWRLHAYIASRLLSVHVVHMWRYDYCAIVGCKWLWKLTAEFRLEKGQLTVYAHH
jgi:hypothetical protein